MKGFRGRILFKITTVEDDLWLSTWRMPACPCVTCGGWGGPGTVAATGTECLLCSRAKTIP